MPVPVPAPFAWDGDHLALALGDAQVRFTTRRGGVSEAPYASLNLGGATGDDAGAVDRNRERLRRGFGLRALHARRQVHGSDVVELDAAAPHADGLVARHPGDGALVLTADCLPVALAAPGVVAMVHAGWRGVAGSVLETAARRLGVGDGVAVQAAIGPGAGGCCYEVGDDLRELFATSGRTLDLKAIARERLLAAGVSEVHDAELCTICTPPDLFFSHRRDGPATGRQGGVAWLS